jgi:glyoxylase-like metal-dependent hydrolase (beta-lactamase superfamily II)
LSLHFNGERVSLVHYPGGHTDGDCVVIFEDSNVVHMGDLFFNHRFPFVDQESGGNVLQFTEAVGQVLASVDEDTKIIPGHGDLATRADLQAYHNMLVECLGAVRKAKEGGASLDQVQAKGVPEQYEDWAWQFISGARWLELLYQSLP